MFTQRKLILILTICILMSFGSILLSFAAEKKMTPLSGIPILEDIKPLAIGDKVPDFSVKDIDGNDFNVSKKIGQSNYVFIFWSIFCEPCKEEMPLIKILTDEYDAKDLTIVAINLDGAPFKNAIKGYANDGGFKFTFIIDELDEEEFFKIADPYGVAGTPTIYIVDKQGIVQFAEVGKVSKAILQEAINKVVKK